MIQILTDREKRFIRYVIIGLTTFAIDLGLLWLFIELAGAHYIIATASAFLIAVSFNYLLSRSLVFRGSARSIWSGYTYFIIFAIVGAALTVSLMWLLVEHTNLHYALVRILIAGFVGIGNYLANLYLNFRLAGEELR